MPVRWIWMPGAATGREFVDWQITHPHDDESALVGPAPPWAAVQVEEAQNDGSEPRFSR
jgi:hypothetical protein